MNLLAISSCQMTLVLMNMGRKQRKKEIFWTITRVTLFRVLKIKRVKLNGSVKLIPCAKSLDCFVEFAFWFAAAADAAR